MPTHATLSRYTLIVEKISHQKNCSLKEIGSYLADHDLGVSERTLARDLEQMRNEFGLDIQYNAYERGYNIQQQSLEETARFLNFIKLAQHSGIAYSNQQEMKELMQYIHFDETSSPKGIEYLRDLLYAIKNRRYTCFDHTNYHTGIVTPYRVKPLLVKQYQYRWYLVAETGKGEHRTFGCDRISKPVIEANTFVVKKNRQLLKAFDQVIGLNYSNGEPQRIEIELTPLQARYLKAAPLHYSQYVVSECEEYTVIALTLIPNFELTQKILMLGDQARVLKPIELSNDIKNSLRSALDRYA